MVGMFGTTTAWRPISAKAARHAVAVADVHGRSDLLSGMFLYLKHMLEGEPDIIMLGDLIDRGHDSIGTIDIVRAGFHGREIQTIAGNHESMLIAGLDTQDPRSMGVFVLWGQNGGHAVLDELEINGTLLGHLTIHERLGKERVDFLRSMQPYIMNGTVLFSHAGIHPHRPLQEQFLQKVTDVFDLVNEEDSIRWVREPWLGYDGPLEDGLFVVYGHTIQRQLPLITSCQAGIDLGGYKSNVLCSLEVKESMIRFHVIGVEEKVKAFEDAYKEKHPE